MAVMIAVYWLIALAVFLIIEIATLGLTTIWFAGGALVAFFACLAGANLSIQFLLFFIISFALLYFTRPYAEKYFNTKREKTNYESLIGKEARVTIQIDNFNHMGTVDLNGQEWTARSENEQIIKEGTKVWVVSIVGVKLIVTDKKEEI